MKKIFGFSVFIIILLWNSSATSNAFAQERVCEQPFETVGIPLTDLGSNNYIRMDGTQTNFTGGLYPNGLNQRPTAHEETGIDIGNGITPLDTAGFPNPNGRIVFISVGMSNAAQEFRDFVKLAKADPNINSLLAIVNGAQPGKVNRDWVNSNSETWNEVDRRLSSGGLSPEQVQIAWVKNTQTGSGAFPAKIQSIQADLEQIARNLKIRYPNIKLAYFSSRTRSYTYWVGLSPEPTAYETGFAVKWMIEKQINGATDLNFNSKQGEVVAPYLSWGPYLWTDGLNLRSDGLIWAHEDMAPDCTHPSNRGSGKVAKMLIDFFKRDETTKSWFLNEPQMPTPTFSPTPEQIKTYTPIFNKSWLDNILSFWFGFINSFWMPK